MNWANWAIIFGGMAILGIGIILLERVLTQQGGAEGEESRPSKCQYREGVRPCFHGSVSFQNCEGKFLSVTKPYNRLEWQDYANSKSCFLLRKPLFDISPQPIPGIDQKYFCSIESNRYPGYFLRADSKGELALESIDNMAVKHFERNDFIFQIEKGINGQLHTVTIRTVTPKYGNACFFDDDTGLKFTVGECGSDNAFKNRASFYIGLNVDSYDWWWKKASLFKYDTLNPGYRGRVLGDSMARAHSSSPYRPD